MTIEILFEKMSDPSQKRVLYGVYWAINKMKDCGTKSTRSEYRNTFEQWIPSTTAKYILPKLHDFNFERRQFVNIVNIGGDTVTVTYLTGMANDNVRITVSVQNTDKIKKEMEERQRIETEKYMAEKEQQELIGKMLLHIVNVKIENPKATDTDLKNELILKFGENNATLMCEKYKIK